MYWNVNGNEKRKTLNSQPKRSPIYPVHFKRANIKMHNSVKTLMKTKFVIKIWAISKVGQTRDFVSN